MITYRISEEQLFDYMKCPIYYGLKYGKTKLNVDKPPTMRRLLNRVVRSFCVTLMNGRVMGMDHIKTKWNMVCKENLDYMTNERIRNGINLLYLFYQWAADNEIQIADVGTSYSILIPDTKDVRYQFTGTLGITMVNQKDQFQGLCLDYGPKLPDKADIDQDFKVTLDHIGFQKSFHKERVNTCFHHVKRDRDFYTYRDLATEKSRAIQIIRNVARSIRHNIWYPHNTPFCKTCEAREFCSVFGSEMP